MPEPTTNYFGQLLIELADHIKTAVPEIRWIDQDLGQLETFEYRPAVDFPCVLIDFVASSYSEVAELAQLGDVTVVLRIGFAPFSQSNQAAPMDVRIRALDFYRLEQLVYEAVQGWHNEFTQPLIRVGADTERRNDALRVRALTFTTMYEDYSALPMNNKQQANLNFDIL
jgi:hypothetical protein